jgi:hypothetical protein
LLPKPAVVVEQLIHRLLHQFFGLAACRGSHVAQRGFLVGAKANFHGLKVEAARKDVKRRADQRRADQRVCWRCASTL